MGCDSIMESRLLVNSQRVYPLKRARSEKGVRLGGSATIFRGSRLPYMKGSRPVTSGSQPPYVGHNSRVRGSRFLEQGQGVYPLVLARTEKGVRPGGSATLFWGSRPPYIKDLRPPCKGVASPQMWSRLPHKGVATLEQEQGVYPLERARSEVGVRPGGSATL